MKQTKTLLLLSLIFILFTTSCKKDEPSRTDFLTSENGWKYTSLTSNSEEITEAFIALVFSALDPVNQTPENEAEIRNNLEFELDIEDLDDCDKDDVITFGGDGKVSRTSGADKCNPSEPDQGNAGTWFLNADETVLTLVDNIGFANDFEVFSINESKAELVNRSTLLEFFGEEEFEEFKDIAGYEDFVASDILITLTMVAN
ncbi:MAG: hypothetical protein AB8B69_17300 [Chitinophagales bacterium]